MRSSPHWGGLTIKPTHPHQVKARSLRLRMTTSVTACNGLRIQSPVQIHKQSHTDDHGGPGAADPRGQNPGHSQEEKSQIVTRNIHTAWVQPQKQHTPWRFQEVRPQAPLTPEGTFVPREPCHSRSATPCRRQALEKDVRLGRRQLMNSNSFRLISRVSPSLGPPSPWALLTHQDPAGPPSPPSTLAPSL